MQRSAPNMEVGQYLVTKLGFNIYALSNRHNQMGIDYVQLL